MELIELEVKFKHRKVGRLFLNKTVKRNKFFKEYFNFWRGRSIVFRFNDEEQREVMTEIIKGTLDELKLDYEV